MVYRHAEAKACEAGDMARLCINSYHMVESLWDDCVSVSL